MVKNPDDGLDENFPRPVNSILCHNAFVKECIIQKIIDASPAATLLLDFDRLYTGYLNSGIITTRDSLKVCSPSKEDWKDVLVRAAMHASVRRAVLIIDSVNGLFSMFDEIDPEEHEDIRRRKDAGRHVNACMMMLSRCVMNAGGRIFLCSVAKIMEDEGWILQPTGRHVPDFESVSKFFVKRQDGLRVEQLSQENKTEKIFHL